MAIAEFRRGPFIQNNQARVGGDVVIPWRKNNEGEAVAVASFPDHGKPIFFGSLIRNNELFLELAQELNSEGESERINNRIRTEINDFLDNNRVSPVALVPPGPQSPNYDPNLPIVRVAAVGNPFSDESIRIYHYWGRFNGAPAFYQLAIARKKDSPHIEKVFGGFGYHKDDKWDTKKMSGHHR